MTFKLGLSLPSKKNNAAAAEPLRPAFGFADGNDDKHEPDRAKPHSSLKKLTSQQSTEEEDEADESIYDFDATYDALHAKEAEEKATKKAAAAERRSQYMDGLLASAEIRKRDQLRYREKVLQREREAEGEDFTDKQKFVTAAYKKQQEEVRRMEEEEKIKEAEEAKRKRIVGMAGLHHHILSDRERRYEETMAAASEAQKKGIKLDTEPKEKSDLELAEEMNAKGADIAINDEGKLVDERQLLKGGLNIVSKPKKPAPIPQPSDSVRYSSSQPVRQDRDAARRAQRERQTRMLEAQLEQATKRAADDEADKQRDTEHKIKSKKTEGDISSARERYLQRKREAEAKKAAEQNQTI